MIYMKFLNIAIWTDILRFVQVNNRQQDYNWHDPEIFSIYYL